MIDQPTINLALYAQTDVGMVRSGNEDNFLILDLSTGKSWTAVEQEPPELLTYSEGYYGSLLAVSDGMGGALAGEVASRMAVETVRDRMLQLQAHPIFSEMSFPERLRVAVEQANQLIHDESQSNPLHKGLGATFTAVAARGGAVFFAQVGDSRAYLIRRGSIHRITKDQSLVQQLIDAGQITEEEAETHSYRNVILQALGAQSSVNVEVNTILLCHLDTLVICSDGLSGKIHQHEIADIVERASNFKSACNELIRLANQRGGEDNITVVIAQFSGNGLPMTTDGGVTPQSLLRLPSTPVELNWSLGINETKRQEAETEQRPPTDPLPVPPPPAKSQPFSGPLTGDLQRREVTERPMSIEEARRRGPITSVFIIGDEEQGPSGSLPDETPEAPRERSTAPLTESKSQPAQSKGSEKGSESATVRDESGAAKQTSPATVEGRSVHTPPGALSKGSSGTSAGLNRNLLATIGVTVVAVAALIAGLFYYVRREEAEKKQQQQEETRLILDERKRVSVRRLRDKIDDINRRLSVQAADKPALKGTLGTWRERLDKLTQRLEEVSLLPSQPEEMVMQGCEEIGRELQKIEDELNNLQGLLPLADDHPVRV